LNKATISVICLLLLSGCSFFSNAPESRATQFIETLVVDPGNSQRLRGLADITADQDPRSLVHGLSTQVALDYLRTRNHQGEKQDFSIEAVRLQGSSRRVVTVLVDRAGRELDRSEAVRFHVVLKDVASRGWLVTAVEAE